jgi:hypothetical protein
MPPAKKLRRAGFSGAAGGGQQAQQPKAARSKGFRASALDLSRSRRVLMSLIPALIALLICRPV